MDIFDVERELSILIDTDKKAWVQMYLLLDKVEQEKLWKSTHNRFGAWLSHYAKKKNINESLLWHRRQAGRFYSKFAERAALQHHDVTKIEEINIPPDSLNIAERIAAKDDAVADELIGKLLNNEITRQELLSVWGRVKADAKAKKEQERFEAIPYRYSSPAVRKVEARDIIMLLSKPDWLPASMKNTLLTIDDGENYLQKEKRFGCTYRTASQFPVRHSGLSYPYFLDLVVLENFSVDFDDKLYQTHIHAIKVITSPEVLEDKNFLINYPLFSDYTWLAVPEDLAEAASAFSPEWLGIISVCNDRKTINIVKEARVFEKDNIKSKLQVMSTFMVQYKYQ